jgi:hypothetical protein
MIKILQINNQLLVSLVVINAELGRNDHSLTRATVIERGLKPLKILHRRHPFHSK